MPLAPDYEGPKPRPVSLEINDGSAPYRLNATLLRTFGDRIVLEGVAGTRFYQGALARLACLRPRDGFPCVLIHQPINPHDPNAIAIWTRGGHVGYIPRVSAPKLLPPLARLEAEHGTLIAIPGTLLAADYGLDLYLELPEDLRD